MEQIAVWEMNKKKTKPKDVAVMHAILENVGVNVDVLGKYYGNEILKRNLGEKGEVSGDEDEVFHDAEDEKQVSKAMFE